MYDSLMRYTLPLDLLEDSISYDSLENALAWIVSKRSSKRRRRLLVNLMGKTRVRLLT